MITLDHPTLDEVAQPWASAPATQRARALSWYACWALALLSLGAAGIHFAVAGEHFSVDWAHGTFFVVVAWLELAWAVAIVVKPSRRLLLAGIIGNLMIVDVWLVSRTIGIPFGANAGVAEPASFVDVLATSFELAIVVGALALRRSRLANRPVPVVKGLAGLTGVGALVVALSSLSLTPAFASAHHGGGSHAGGNGHDHGTQSQTATALGGSATPAGHAHHGLPGPNADQVAELQPNKPLDAPTRAQLAAQLTQARAVAMRYPTVADVQRAGYYRAGTFAPGVGAHYVGGASGYSLGFDIERPLAYIYDGISPTSRVVGIMYYSFGDQAPEGFAGPNDHWHRHSAICIKPGPTGLDVPLPADSDVTAAQCTQVGGSFMAKTAWMLHAWVVPGWESPAGVFSHDNPDLHCADGTDNTDAVGFCQGT